VNNKDSLPSVSDLWY